VGREPTTSAAGTGAPYRGPMSEHPDEDRIDRRAELLPEEQEAGSADPEAQAEAVLADSDERTDDPEGTRDESVQTPGESDSPA